MRATTQRRRNLRQRRAARIMLKDSAAISNGNLFVAMIGDNVSYAEFRKIIGDNIKLSNVR